MWNHITSGIRIVNIGIGIGAICGGAGLAAGILLGGFVFWTTPEPAPLPKQAGPIIYGDVRAVLEALQPFERGSRFDRVSICARGPMLALSERADVLIEYHPSYGSTVRMSGSDISDAIQNGTQFNAQVQAVLAPFVKDKQPGKPRLTSQS